MTYLLASVVKFQHQLLKFIVVSHDTLAPLPQIVQFGKELMPISLGQVPLPHKVLQPKPRRRLSPDHLIPEPLDILPPHISIPLKMSYRVATLLFLGEVIELEYLVTRRLLSKIHFGITLTLEDWVTTFDRVYAQVSVLVAFPHLSA